MEMSLILEYAWVLLVLVMLEGILSADNALVLAIMVKHLPEKQRSKALYYGLFGAFVFRFGSLFLISHIANIWQVQALGAIYLMYICIHNLRKLSKAEEEAFRDAQEVTEVSKKEFWLTVLKVELADIAFAIDSILAAVALAMTITPSGLGMIGSLDIAQFAVVFLGGMIGLLIMRFAANFFVKLLKERPSLEKAAFIIVGWVGVKLVVTTLAHPALAIVPYEFAHSAMWKFMFYGVLAAIAAWGFLSSKKKEVLPSTAKEVLPSAAQEENPCH